MDSQEHPTGSIIRRHKASRSRSMSPHGFHVTSSVVVPPHQEAHAAPVRQLSKVLGKLHLLQKAAAPACQLSKPVCAAEGLVIPFSVQFPTAIVCKLPGTFVLGHVLLVGGGVCPYPGCLKFRSSCTVRADRT